MDVAQSALTRFVIGQHARMTVFGRFLPVTRGRNRPEADVHMNDRSHLKAAFPVVVGVTWLTFPSRDLYEHTIDTDHAGT